MKKLIQLIDRFDGPQSTLSNEEFFIREKLLLYLKISPKILIYHIRDKK